MERKVKALFEFDGEEAFSGEICLKVNGCRFGEVEIPCNYAVLLLKEDYNGEAHRLLQELTELTKAGWVRSSILNTACGKGFGEAWKLVERFRDEAPNGKPRFYMDSCRDWDMTPDLNYVVLTDGDVGFIFRVGFIVKGLTVNAYVTPTYLPFTLSAYAYKEAERQIGEFWEFAKRVRKCKEHLSDLRIEKTLQVFFSNRDEAYKLLEAAEADANHICRREETFNNLQHEGVLNVQGGYLVGSGGNAYQVSEDGAVYKLDYRKPVDLKEAVLKMVEGGKPLKKLAEVNEEWELTVVGKHIGKVRPDLAIVIIPHAQTVSTVS
jgi:hypothetical protein